MSDRQPILDQINLVAGDLGASVSFYRALGVEIPDASGGWGEHHRTAEFGDSEAVDFDLDSRAFAAVWGAAEVPQGPLLGFRVETRGRVDELWAALTGAGHRGLRAPYDAFWGARYAIVEDPSGVAVGIMSEASAEFQSAPPEPSSFG